MQKMLTKISHLIESQYKFLSHEVVICSSFNLNAAIQVRAKSNRQIRSMSKKLIAYRYFIIP